MNRSTTAGSGDPQDTCGVLQPIDLLLGEGTAAEQSELQARIAGDPWLAIEQAENVALLEQMRQLRIEPSNHYTAKLADVLRRSERRVGRPASVVTPGRVLWAAAAAAVTFAALWHVDPLAVHKAVQQQSAASVPLPDAASGELAAVSEPTGSAGEELAAEEPAQVRAGLHGAAAAALEAMRRRFELEPSSRLSSALAAALQPSGDPLGRWLDPRNAVVLLRLDHELRAREDVRQEALRRQGGFVAIDRRVQELAESVALDLPRRFAAVPFEPAPALGEVALAVRAMIAAGPTSAARERALAAGSEWLAQQLRGTSGPQLATGLAALVEVAAVHGWHADLVATEGERFLAEVLRADADTWGRRRPEMLTPQVPAATVADAGRLLTLLAGFGADPMECAMVRQLLLGQLQERRDLGEDGPELLAALVFGFSDLLPEAERDEVDRQVRRWKLARLVPDFVTALQLAWGVEPGRIGFTRLQGELRQLAVVPEPEPLGARAALCLCLASNYGASRGLALQRLASGW